MRLVSRFIAVMIVVTLCLRSGVQAYESDTLALGGALRLTGIGLLIPMSKADHPGGHIDPIGLMTERLRLKLDAQPNDMLVANIELDLTSIQTTEDALRPLLPQMDADLYRAYVAAYLGDFDVRLGIQRVAWGVGHYFNPTNTFSALQFGDPTQELAGIPAVLVRHPLGNLGMATVVAAVSNDGATRQMGTNWVFNIAEIDFGLVGAFEMPRRETLAGLNVKGELEVGYWLEAAWTRRFKVSDSDRFEIEAGVDYTFEIGDTALYVSVEHYFQSDPLPPLTLTQLAQQNPLLSLGGPAVLQEKHYLYSMIRFDMTDELSLATTTLANVKDPSGNVFGYLSVAAWDNLDIFVGATAPFGKVDSEFVPRTTFPANHYLTALLLTEAHF